MSDDDFDMAGAGGTASVASAAMAWVEHVRRGELAAAWSAMTPDFRLWVIQGLDGALPGGNGGPVGPRPQPGRGRGGPGRAGADASGVERGAARVAERALDGATIGVLGYREYGTGTRLRPIGQGLELVRLISLDQLDSCGLAGRPVGPVPWDALRGWCKQATVDAGNAPGTTTADAKRLTKPEHGVQELKGAFE